MKVFVAVLLFCAVLPNAHGLFGKDFVSDWSKTVQQYIEPKEWKETLEKSLDETLVTMRNWTKLGKDMAEEYKEKAEQFWNENKNVEPKEWKETLEKRLDETLVTMRNWTKLGKDMAEEYKEKAEQFWNEHKNLEPKEWREKFNKQWEKVNDRVENVTEMGMDMLEEVRERTEKLIFEYTNKTIDEHMENARQQTNKAWVDIKELTKDTMNFTSGSMEKLQKILEKGKPKQRKVLKQLRKTARNFIRTLSNLLSLNEQTEQKKLEAGVPVTQDRVAVTEIKKPRKPLARLSGKFRRFGEK